MYDTVTQKPLPPKENQEALKHAKQAKIFFNVIVMIGEAKKAGEDIKNQIDWSLYNMGKALNELEQDIINQLIPRF